MGPFLTSFLFTIGAATWVYFKLQNHSGNNTQQSLVASSVFAVITFIIFFSIATMVMK